MRLAEHALAPREHARAQLFRMQVLVPFQHALG